MSTVTSSPNPRHPRTQRNHRPARSVPQPYQASAPEILQRPQYLNEPAQSSDMEARMENSQPTTPPRTPHKIQNTSIFHGQPMVGAEGVLLPKPRGRGRPKSLASTPAVQKTATSFSSSSRGQPESTSTPPEPIYAGATFHASPAPSSLPIPSFYSKSVPDSPGLGGFQMMKDQSSTKSDDSPTPPAAQLVPPHPEREESPLDFFFKADRQEKGRTRSATSFHGSHPTSGPFPLPRDGTPTPSATPGRDRKAHFSGGSSSAIFAMELDGTNSPGKAIGPAFSTPYQERINAAKASSISLPSTPPTPSDGPSSKSEALKAFLFSGQSQSAFGSGISGSPDIRKYTSAQPVSNSLPRQTPGGHNSFTHGGFSPTHVGNPSIHGSLPGRHSPRAGSRSSGLRQEITPTVTPEKVVDRATSSYSTLPTPTRTVLPTPPGNSYQMGSDSRITQDGAALPPKASSMNDDSQLRGMEAHLRRLLKIESAGI
jgi:hypothetical protein